MNGFALWQSVGGSLIVASQLIFNKAGRGVKVEQQKGLVPKPESSARWWGGVECSGCISIQQWLPTRSVWEVGRSEGGREVVVGGAALPQSRTVQWAGTKRLDGGGCRIGPPWPGPLDLPKCKALHQFRQASSQQLKFTTSDSCDRIKDEFQFLQAQYHSLKLECDKLASEKSEMQRHYIMAEIVKRLNGICAQVLPYLSQEHQQQVLAAIERAKQVTPPEMNSIIRQQLQAHQLSQLQGLALPMTPLPLGLTQPTLPAVTTSSGLFSLSSLLASQAQLAKEEKASRDGVDSHREEDGDKTAFFFCSFLPSCCCVSVLIPVEFLFFLPLSPTSCLCSKRKHLSVTQRHNWTHAFDPSKSVTYQTSTTLTGRFNTYVQHLVGPNKMTVQITLMKHKRLPQHE
ncbi:hypothetical protein FQN60_013325 [Etheostoma spectabile]|uniref:Groucho/TLE N-terminal Q-rich domain-containing protein n=1 Tax=Etheostoma spectabile TaxID=54343 RepID=A0A5J5DAQ3_9PERO|nr:hypothetical protein FQN60_013325 [Etheostoma spectabile]